MRVLATIFSKNGQKTGQNPFSTNLSKPPHPAPFY
jgi:hypothetical protein